MPDNRKNYPGLAPPCGLLTEPKRPARQIYVTSEWEIRLGTKPTEPFVQSTFQFLTALFCTCSSFISHIPDKLPSCERVTRTAKRSQAEFTGTGIVMTSRSVPQRGEPATSPQLYAYHSWCPLTETQNAKQFSRHAHTEARSRTHECQIPRRGSACPPQPKIFFPCARSYSTKHGSAQEFPFTQHTGTTHSNKHVSPSQWTSPDSCDWWISGA